MKDDKQLETHLERNGNWLELNIPPEKKQLQMKKTNKGV